jgi:hypothetical protein
MVAANFSRSGGSPSSRASYLEARLRSRLFVKASALAAIDLQRLAISLRSSFLSRSTNLSSVTLAKGGGRKPRRSGRRLRHTEIAKSDIRSVVFRAGLIDHNAMLELTLTCARKVKSGTTGCAWRGEDKSAHGRLETWVGADGNIGSGRRRPRSGRRVARLLLSPWRALHARLPYL